MEKFRIALGGDHAGFKTKADLIAFLTKQGHDVIDVGTHSEESCDYPDFSFLVGKAVASGKADRGILACGTGIGVSIAANKVKGIRAALCWNTKTAKLASEHNWANVLCVPSRIISEKNIRKIVQAWLKTPNDKSERHARRIKKIARFESKSS